jgi:hypothetical protein
MEVCNMWFLVLYDLDSAWLDVKEAALERGFRDYVVTLGGERVPLPNTTLLVEAMSAPEAMEMFKAVVRETSPRTLIHRAATFDWERGQTYTDIPDTDPLAALFLRRPFF